MRIQASPLDRKNSSVLELISQDDITRIQGYFGEEFSEEQDQIIKGSQKIFENSENIFKSEQ